MSNRQLKVLQALLPRVIYRVEDVANEAKVDRDCARRVLRSLTQGG